MRANGARCVLSPQARAVHGYSLTLGARSGRKYAMTGWSRGYLLRRYGITASASPAPQALGREAAICAGQLLRDRTLAGAEGPDRGLARRHGACRQRQLPAAAVTRLSLRRALALRSSGHGA